MGRVVVRDGRRSEGELSRLVREKLSADLSWNRRTFGERQRWRYENEGEQKELGGKDSFQNTG